MLTGFIASRKGNALVGIIGDGLACPFNFSSLLSLERSKQGYMTPGEGNDSLNLGIHHSSRNGTD